MRLSRLTADGVRNLSNVSLNSLPRVNIIFGHNGSGKTSILEAIHLLGLARSFRGQQMRPIIAYERDECTVFGRVLDGGDSVVGHDIGVSRSKSGRSRIRIDGDEQRNAVGLAETLPLQLINSHAFLLLEGGPKQRRQFIDWGVFHVEHSFVGDWRAMQRCVKQRNSLLRERRRAPPAQLTADLQPWNKELAVLAERIDALRRRYLAALMPELQRILACLGEIPGLALHYAPGWASEQPILQCLQDDLQRDSKRGITHSGPHRADLTVTVNGLPAVQVLSRGQQKLVVCAMRMAQTELLYRQTGKRSVMLIDDLPAEMDAAHQYKLCDVLNTMQAQPQLFMTGVEPFRLAEFTWTDTLSVGDSVVAKGDTEVGTPSIAPPALFHVEQGRVQRHMGSIIASEPN